MSAEQEYLLALGRRVRRSRERQHMSRLTLAKLTGMHRNTILRLEKGLNVNVYTVVSVIRVLKWARQFSSSTISETADAIGIDPSRPL